MCVFASRNARTRSISAPVGKATRAHVVAIGASQLDLHPPPSPTGYTSSLIQRRQASGDGGQDTRAYMPVVSCNTRRLSFPCAHNVRCEQETSSSERAHRKTISLHHQNNKHNTPHVSSTCLLAHVRWLAIMKLPEMEPPYRLTSRVAWARIAADSIRY